jgi:methionyl-tRNA formyltransferase
LRAAAAKSLRVAFFGTPEFALPTLERLLAGRHPVVVVVSQPDRPRGRGRRVSPSPVAGLALARGLPLLRPEKVAQAESALREARPDLGVVVAFGQFVPRRIRELPALGYCINGHASLLPRWRGAAPIERAILAGDTATGVSVMRVEREMDAGAVARQARLEIGAEETGGELAARMAALAAEQVALAVDEIAEGHVRFTPQDESRATFARKLTRDDARLDFAEPATELLRRVRALAPSPGAFTSWRGETLRVLAAHTLPGAVDRPPGRVRNERGLPLCIATGDGWLAPRVLQRAGRQPLDVDAFLRGCALPDGAALG